MESLERRGHRKLKKWILLIKEIQFLALKTEIDEVDEGISKGELEEALLRRRNAHGIKTRQKRRGRQTGLQRIGHVRGEVGLV
ncbi:hypothetical protein OsJ_24007 [Oryza sativa Japonica Group]|uniref:Uncharacterized protein n=1 Tax=Oryza sativa subsp. japonica TaxID=39947 RepID=Q6Z3Q8_ORYSJ|nr:hypothetical protein OsJ_24007 [Oryza sativa Japonica Group]BAC84110.1 hypothetical protein [Oryza sativa Japonica Group]